LQDQVIDSVGDSWPDWKIVFELGRQLGLKEAFPWKTAEEAIDYQLEPSGLTVQQLRDNPDGIRCDQLQYEKYKTDGFKTPSGKIEFYSETLKNSGYEPVPAFSDQEENRISFYDQKDQFPYIAISGARPREFVHSQLRHISWLLERESEPIVDIHPDDAAQLMISQGDRVKVTTPKGQVEMIAGVSDIIAPGSVRLAWGWGDHHRNSNLNDLTDDSLRDPITATPSSRCFMCSVKKLESRLA
jgi:anaerobic selenocysteine-containing dehydrogenase